MNTPDYTKILVGDLLEFPSWREEAIPVDSRGPWRVTRVARASDNHEYAKLVEVGGPYPAVFDLRVDRILDCAFFLHRPPTPWYVRVARRLFSR